MTPLVYLLLAIIGALLTAIGFFIAREFSGKDSVIIELRAAIDTLNENNAKTIEELGQTNLELRDLIHELKTWAMEHFMRRNDFTEEHRRLEDRIMERFELHEKNCPALLNHVGTIRALPAPKFGNGG